MAIRWIAENVAIAIHEEQLAEHGGPIGVRDADCVVMILGLAEGKISESRFAEWILAHSSG